MKTITSLFVMLVCCVLQAFPCSTFFINHNGQMVFGRNYDWVAGTGLLCTNHVGLLKSNFQPGNGNPIKWVSQYGSLTFNQWGKEFPTGGMNEKGLVVELMWLDETKYAKNDSRPALGVLQWIQYHLDVSATVEEVIASDTKVRISDDVPIHYLVADAKGNVATIEFLNGKMVVHTGKSLPMPVLTNSIYDESVQFAEYAIKNNETGDNQSSKGRFVKACEMVRKVGAGKVNGALTDYAFDILDAVKQGDFTKWSIVYDITNRKILFKTHEEREVRSVAFGDMKFTCMDKTLSFNINQQSKGDISKSFSELTPELNRTILRESATLSRSEVPVSEQTQNEVAAFWTQVNCRMIHQCRYQSGLVGPGARRP